MPNFGVSRNAAGLQKDALPPVNWQRGFFRLWVLVSAGWTMGWGIYLIMEAIQGSMNTSADLAVLPVLLFGPPAALFLFGLAARWAIRGFEADDAAPPRA